MRYTIVDEGAAPPRPTFRRGGKRRQELEALVGALEGGRVARIEPIGDDKPGAIRRQLLETAARLGRPIDVWDGAEGVVYAAVAAGAGERAE